jgi:uncharacterized protein YkwD
MPHEGNAVTASRSQIVNAHNRIRKRDFKRSGGLDASAQIVANRLARADKGIAHARRWWRVIDKVTKLRFGAKGENLGLGHATADGLMEDLMNSPTHKRNVLGPYDRIGVGIAMGHHTGRPYYVMHYGDRL